jgi:hypothetical protein
VKPVEYPLLTFICSSYDYISSIGKGTNPNASIAAYENRIVDWTAKIIEPIQNLFNRYYEYMYGGSNYAYDDLYITRFLNQLMEWIRSKREEYTKGIFANTYVWIFPLVIIFWKLMYLRDHPLPGGHVPLNMFVTPMSLEDHQQRRRQDEQRRSQGHDFFSFQQNPILQRNGRLYGNRNNYGYRNSNQYTSSNYDGSYNDRYAPNYNDGIAQDSRYDSTMNYGRNVYDAKDRYGSNQTSNRFDDRTYNRGGQNDSSHYTNPRYQSHLGASDIVPEMSQYNFDVPVSQASLRSW